MADEWCGVADESKIRSQGRDPSMNSGQVLQPANVDPGSYYLIHDRGNKAAQVVLEVIDAPVGIHLCILRFVAIASFKSSARSWPRRRIDSQLQSLGMDIVRKRLHEGFCVMISTSGGDGSGYASMSN